MTSIIRADSLRLPLRDESVDLVITSPPYFALRSYQDEGHYEGQIGDEETPRAFLEALWAVTDECQRVMKPTASMFVNLGDKYAGSGGHNNAELIAAGNKHAKPGAEYLGGYHRSEKVIHDRFDPVDDRRDAERARVGSRGGGAARRDASRNASRRNAPDRYNQNGDVRAKSLMGLPWLYALGCTGALNAFAPGVTKLDMILRAEIVWEKPNGLPESVTDRVRRNHEQWFHLTKTGTYFAAIDELREEHLTRDNARSAPGPSGTNRGLMVGQRDEPVGNFARDPAGKLPPSVWSIPTEPLRIPDVARELFDLPDHFAAFPTAWPHAFISGWSPNGICLECGVGRFPVVDKTYEVDHVQNSNRGRIDLNEPDGNSRGINAREGRVVSSTRATIIGYACDCTPRTLHDSTGESSGRSHAQALAEGGYASEDFGGRYKDRPKVGKRTEYHFEGWAPAPTRPAVVLDPFGGTGTVAMVARALGRNGVSVDLSAAYCRLATWRVFHSGHGHRTHEREAEKTVQEFVF